MAEALANECGNSIITVDDAFLKIKEVVSSLDVDKIPRLVEMLRDELANKFEGSSKKSLLQDTVASIKQIVEEFIHYGSTKEVLVEPNVDGFGNTLVLDQDIGKEKSINKEVAVVDLVKTAGASLENEVPYPVDDGDAEDKFGVVFVDQYNTLFGIVRMSNGCREILYKLTVGPPKMRRGGGAATLHNVRLKEQRRSEHSEKTLQVASRLFINPATGQASVSRLIVSANDDGAWFLQGPDTCFDQRLTGKEVCCSRVFGGGEEGFNEAIDECLEYYLSSKLERQA